MRTWTFGRWGVLTSSCLALLTVGTETGRPQPVPDKVTSPAPTDNLPPPSSSGLPALASPTAGGPDLKSPAVRPTPAPTPGPEPTVEDLIKQLEQLRKQKAELDKQEKDVVTRLQQKMKDQVDRLHKLGVLPQNPPLPPDIRDVPDEKLPPAKK